MIASGMDAAMYQPEDCIEDTTRPNLCAGLVGSRHKTLCRQGRPALIGRGCSFGRPEFFFSEKKRHQKHATEPRA